MSFSSQTSKRRNGVLGFGTFNSLVENQNDNLRLWREEHTEAGEHDSREMPRAVGLAYWNGAAYAIRGNSAGVSSIANPAVGEITWTLSGTYFPVNDIVARAIAMPNVEISEPWIANAKINSATSITTYMSKGTAWAAADGSVALIMNAIPRVAPPSASWNVVTKKARTPKSGLDFSSFNKLAKNEAFLNNNLLVEHTSAGVHNAHHIARAQGNVAWGGASYAFDSNPSPGLSGLTTIATGKVRVDLAAATFPNNPNPSIEIAVMPTYLTTPTEQWIALCKQTTITNTGNYVTSFEVWQWLKSSTNTWTLTDGKFSFRLYCAAV